MPCNQTASQLTQTCRHNPTNHCLTIASVTLFCISAMQSSQCQPKCFAKREYLSWWIGQWPWRDLWTSCVFPSAHANMVCHAQHLSFKLVHIAYDEYQINTVGYWQEDIKWKTHTHQTQPHTVQRMQTSIGLGLASLLITILLNGRLHKVARPSRLQSCLALKWISS